MSGKTKGVRPLWNLPDLEQDETQRVPAKLGAFSCILRDVDRPMRVRFGACAGGAASRAEYRLKWQKSGWEPLCERGGLIAFGANAGTPAPEDDGLDRLFDRAIRRLEYARIVSFVLAALCMIVGYAAEGFTVGTVLQSPIDGLVAYHQPQQ